MKLIIYYSVQNGGDGSAYPQFMESEELAEWDQNHMSEDWAESCDGQVVIESDSLMTCKDVVTALGYYLEKGDYWQNEGDKEKFLAEFFPDGLPQMSVTIADDMNYFVSADNKVQYKSFAYDHKTDISQTNEEGRIALEKELNKG